VKSIKLSEVVSKLKKKGLHKTAANLKKVVKGARILDPTLDLILKKAKFRKMKASDYKGYAGANPGSYIYDGSYYDIIVDPEEGLSIELPGASADIGIRWEERLPMVFFIIKKLEKDRILKELSDAHRNVSDPRSREARKLWGAMRNKLREYERL